MNKNIFWNTLGSGMFAANSILVLMLVSRYKGIEIAGVFGISYTTAQILYIIGVFGMNTYQMTDYSEKYSFSDYCYNKVITSILMMVGYFISIIFLNFSRDKMICTLLLTLFMLLNSIGELYQSLLFQKNRVDLAGKMLFFRIFLSSIFFIFTLIFYDNLFVALIIMNIINLITTFYGAKIAKKFICKRGKFNRVAVYKLLLECVPIFVSMFLMTFIIHYSKYALDRISTDEIQGYYNIIFMPALFINLFSGFVFKPLLNRYDKLLKSNIKSFKLLFLKQVGIIFLITIFCCIAAWLVGTQVLGVLYGKDLLYYRYELIVVILGGGIFAICQLMYFIMIILRYQKIVLLNYIISTVITILCSTNLVKDFDIMGASLSFCISHIILLSIYTIAVNIILRRKENA
ncbi:MAG: polysaccharide biosynthesis protein [Clostridiaceae bacterium]|jgi:O-antigen/teichoic acid export membrane protein|nr:polysaccharide biosynthesis protein [Clostridiaceae bacterium]